MKLPTPTHRSKLLRCAPQTFILTLVIASAFACSGDSTASDSEVSASEVTATGPGTGSTATATATATVTEAGSGSTATEATATSEATATATATATTEAESASTTAGESSSSSGDTATGDSSSTGETGVEGPSFTDVYEQIILVQGCNAGYCHGGGAGGLTMTDEATTYANLVEVEAFAPMCGVTMRVVPGSPDESLLWYRARPMSFDGGMDPCAPKMPQGTDGLDDADGQLLFDWITAGALD